MEDTIYAMFKKTARDRANEPAIIEDGQMLSFKELSDLVDLIAGTFPENIKSVGIVMAHRAEMVASMLAVLKCGARYVPAEPDFPIGRIRYMMDEAEVDFILADREYAGLSSFEVRLIGCEICGKESPSPASACAATPDSPAYVLYTSGTTGRPKGVCVTNRNVCHYARAFKAEFHIGPGDVMLQYSVCSFDIFVEEVFASLLNGAALAIPTEKEKKSLPALMDFVRRHSVTMISGFPYLLADINNLADLPPSLRLLISGGDVLREAYVDNLLDKVEVYNTYGPSETTVCATYYRCNGGLVLKDGTYPIGHPVKGADVRILESCGEEVPHGEIGEICIFGDGVSLGYVGDHDEENRAFVRKEGAPPLYRSGDMGYVLPNGAIAFLHRKDTQVMIFGKRVEPAEVEARLYGCRGVSQALVKAFADEDGLAYLVGYVVPASEGVKASELAGELSENLPAFMIPEFFVKLESIPLNANGKPDFERLPVVLKAHS